MKSIEISYVLFFLLATNLLPSCQKHELDSNQLEEYEYELKKSVENIISSDSYNQFAELKRKSKSNDSDNFINYSLILENEFHLDNNKYEIFNNLLGTIRTQLGHEELNKVLIKVFKELPDINHIHNPNHFELRAGTPCYDRYESEMLYNIGVLGACVGFTWGWGSTLCVAVFIHDSQEDARTFHECCGC